MKMDYKKFCSETLTHYKRMRKWAEKQNPEERVDEKKMLDEIGENWNNNYCIYCVMHGDWLSCGNCPLKTDYGCCDDLWSKMDNSGTWSQWLYWEEKIEKFIKEHGVPIEEEVKT